MPRPPCSYAGALIFKFPTGPAASIQLLVRNEGSVSRAVELRLRGFARTRRFAEMSVACSDGVSWRLRSASHFCLEQKRAKASPRPESFEEVFLWLTIECWPVLGPLWADAVAKADG